LCCNSYLCSNNWSPRITIKALIEQLEEFRLHKNNIFLKFVADAIKDKYLIDDINLDEWLFTPFRLDHSLVLH
jgi:hypothetical protein